MKTRLKSVALLTLVVTGTLLGGCTVVPAQSGGYYRPPTVYVEARPVYRVAPPPMIVYPPAYDGHRHGHGRHHWHDHDGHRW